MSIVGEILGPLALQCLVLQSGFVTTLSFVKFASTHANNTDMRIMNTHNIKRNFHSEGDETFQKLVMTFSCYKGRQIKASSCL
jgi:hypothetical protein